jgi:sodium-dependent dicarboxylate transporter 2/3/5
MTTANGKRIDVRRLAAMFAGIALFLLVYFSPDWPDAAKPEGGFYPLPVAGKTALAIFLLAGVWWVFEVVPIGVTSLIIGLLQVLFIIDDSRTAKVVFGDFMDPSVMFIFGSIVIGIVFTKTGLTHRMAYKMLVIVGERTSMILLGCFVLTVALTHIMAHTAVAATMYPLLVAVSSLYGDSDRPTKFGKSLFMGMAYVAGAGSIVTLLGAARGAVAIGFFKEIVGREVSFFELSYYMFPIGWLMLLVLWGFFMVFLRPEKRTVPGLRDRARDLYAQLGPISRKEILAVVIVVGMILTLCLRTVFPVPPHKTAIILVATSLFFVFRVLKLEDLESIPWNIILLFGGAMSIGFCLWQTGAAEWMALTFLNLIKGMHWLVFVLGLSVFVMLMTNFIMNVAAIAISLPVALRMAQALHIAPEIILFSSLVVAGMPFLMLVGAAPNAIAYNSKQFTSGEFFRCGVLASILLIAVVALAALVIWPLMGMPILVKP